MPMWLTIFLACGGTTLINLVITFIFTKMTNSMNKKRRDAEIIAEELSKKNDVLKKGVQALLRHVLYDIYDEYNNSRGYAPLDVKNDFENIYDCYHHLGKNGVMDGMHDRFMQLPEENPKKEKKMLVD